MTEQPQPEISTEPPPDLLDRRFAELMAGAWDAGYAAGVEDTGHGWRQYFNPYHRPDLPPVTRPETDGYRERYSLGGPDD